MKWQGVWRTGNEGRDPEHELYPGVVVCDGRVTGSITAGATRLPIWAFIYELVRCGWDCAADSYNADDYISPEQLGSFLYDLLEMRGEFGRLLLVLANAERVERTREDWEGDEPWWDLPEQRDAVLAQLRLCVECLEQATEEATAK